METMSTWAVVVHSLFLVVEIFIGILFVFACWSRREPKPTSVGQLQSREVNAKHIPCTSSTPIKRRHSLQDKSTSLVDNHQIQELNATKRRASLDLSSRLTNENLTRRQRKKLNRRLSRANTVRHECPDTCQLNGVDNVQAQTNQQAEEIVNGVNSVQVNVNEDPSTVLKLNNMFGLLNHSQHADPDFEALTPLDKRKFMFNGRGGSNGSLTRSVTPDSTARSTPSHRRPGGGGGSKKSSKKRSKSTSPPRRKIGESIAKQKDLFKNFDPDNVDWIQTGTSSISHQL